MKLYFTLSRRYLLLICVAAVVVLLVSSRFSQSKNVPENAVANSERTGYINSLGYVVDETPVMSKPIEIPFEFSQEYEWYNNLQRQAGYDLSKYKGCEAQLYSYEITDKPQGGPESTVTLIVYNGRIIGGDVCEAKHGGKMLPLKTIKTE